MHSKRELAVALSRLRPFPTPKPQLEQYPTDSEVAASLLWDAYMTGDIEDKNILDLGAGTGILGIGALLLRARHVTFVEIDPDTETILAENLARTGIKERYTLLTGDVSTVTQNADTILQNPPFGTRNKGADTHFLQASLRLGTVVYSLHKTTTEPYIERLLERDKKTYTKQRFRFPLKQTLRHHTRRTHRIEVTCFRIT